MPFILITTISIFVIAGTIWLLNGVWSFTVCPICAGVSGTWLWMLAGQFLGYPIDTTILAMLMGGSVVGIAYQIEKRLLPKHTLFWKVLFIPIGFIAAYSLLMSWWTAFAVLLVILLALGLGFVSKSRPKVAAPSGRASLQEMRREELERKMKNCC